MNSGKTWIKKDYSTLFLETNLTYSNDTIYTYGRLVNSHTLYEITNKSNSDIFNTRFMDNIDFINISYIDFTNDYKIIVSASELYISNKYTNFNKIYGMYVNNDCVTYNNNIIYSIPSDNTLYKYKLNQITNELDKNIIINYNNIPDNTLLKVYNIYGQLIIVTNNNSELKKLKSGIYIISTIYGNYEYII